MYMCVYNCNLLYVHYYSYVYMIVMHMYMIYSW